MPGADACREGQRRSWTDHPRRSNKSRAQGRANGCDLLRLSGISALQVYVPSKHLGGFGTERPVQSPAARPTAPPRQVIGTRALAWPLRTPGASRSLATHLPRSPRSMPSDRVRARDVRMSAILLGWTRLIVMSSPLKMRVSAVRLCPSAPTSTFPSTSCYSQSWRHACQSKRVSVSVAFATACPRSGNGLGQAVTLHAEYQRNPR
jgi:hypothetical protein